MKPRGPGASSGSLIRDRQEGSMTVSPAFIDVNAQIGPATGGARGATLETVARERDRHGIRITLVRHRTALLAESTLGNRNLLDEIEGDPGLAAVAVLSVDRAAPVKDVAP